MLSICRFESLNMDAPHLVDVTVRLHPEFKRHPFKSIETDPTGALCGVPYGVLHVEDIISYIHYKLEDFRIFAIFDQYRVMCNKDGLLEE